MDGELFLYVVAGFFGGIVLFVLGLIWFRQKRMIENIPTSKIRSLAMGLAEIYGQVVKDKFLLKGPFSGDDCVYYKYTIQELRHAKNSSYWATIKKGEERVNFYLKDETGFVLVDPKGANIDIAKDYEFGSGWGSDPPQKVLQFLEANGVHHEGFFGANKQMRFMESSIEPGDKLYILGTAGDNPFVEEATARQSAEDAMIQKGRFDRFYYISDKPEKDILSRLRWKSLGGIFGGIALIAGCMAVIFIFTGLL
jgi:hypothetical protein